MLFCEALLLVISAKHIHQSDLLHTAAIQRSVVYVRHSLVHSINEACEMWMFVMHTELFTIQYRRRRHHPFRFRAVSGFYFVICINLISHNTKVLPQFVSTLLVFYSKSFFACDWKLIGDLNVEWVGMKNKTKRSSLSRKHENKRERRNEYLNAMNWTGAHAGYLTHIATI